MHEHIARAVYYFSVHLLFASIVASAAWALTSIPRASATTKYWIWVATAFNFVLPSGALVDKLWALHLTWARPLGAIGGSVWDMTQGRTAVILAVIWMTGGFAMISRLISRVRRELREAQALASLSNVGLTSEFLAHGIPVSFGDGQSGPAVRGVLHPRILLPVGIDRLLNPGEFHAVLIHELAHARRRDNLIRLLYEASLCALWFHPLMWLAGARIGLYRELSCDESVIRRAHGQELVSALAKLTVLEQPGVLQATASSHLRHRLARLAGSAQATHRAASLLLASLFTAIIVGGVFGTVAHTACCFVRKH
ncbi:MAG TPA: M56 family metallopeptidase [Candidatus Polarisedimenticolia bacterium]|nr:M56 family metallopeptidase [Candidatus Polarisedimenticolia bacterium]